MKVVDLVRSANGNLARNKGRSFLTILAVFIGSFTIILTSGIRTGVNSYIGNQLDAIGGEGFMMIMHSSMTEHTDPSVPRRFDEESAGLGNNRNATMLRDADVEAIRGVEGIISAQPMLNVSVVYIQGVAAERYVTSVSGMPIENISLDIWAGEAIDNSSRELQVNLLPAFVEVLGFESDEDAIGRKVTFGVRNRTTHQIEHVEATIVGVMNRSVLAMGAGDGQLLNRALVERIREVTMDGVPEEMLDMYISVAAEFDPNLSAKEIDALKERLGEAGDYVGMTIRDIAGMVVSFFDAIIMVFTIFGGIALLAASIGIVNTLFMAVQERTREIGLMKAMGLGKGKIFMMFSMEAIALGFWGSALGIAVAFVTRAIVNPLAARTFLADLPGFNLLMFDAQLLTILVLLVMLIAFLAGSLPARRAARKDPIEALRYE